MPYRLSKGIINRSIRNKKTRELGNKLTILKRNSFTENKRCKLSNTKSRSRYTSFQNLII